MGWGIEYGVIWMVAGLVLVGAVLVIGFWLERKL